MVDSTLREMHWEVFRVWLGFRLQQQERDLSVWLVSLGRSQVERFQLLHGMSRRLGALIPHEHLPPEGQLFINDFRLVVALLGWTRPDATGEE